MAVEKDTREQLDNVALAELNDLAYKAFRKQGNQRALDKRAIKNVEFQNQLDQELQKAKQKIQPDKLRQKYADIVTKIGNCPYSQNDTIDALQEGDCMCICLQISRSEATIQDPTKLVIKKIIPTYMSLDMFLESSTFMLKQNQDASGGFDYSKQG